MIRKICLITTMTIFGIITGVFAEGLGVEVPGTTNEIFTAGISYTTPKLLNDKFKVTAGIGG